MKMLNEIRKLFLDFFAKNGHRIIQSSSLVPKKDQTLLFTNSGMVQFKDHFLGNVSNSDFYSAASVQKCVRAGGKHNDLENVGYTYRHHTFFEMLGNFSFGEYGKEKAISLAWEFVTKKLKLLKERLCVTIYYDDYEAFEIWKRISNLPDERIIRIHTSDNFWSMGEVGPCGPCSEIFYDKGEHILGGMPGTEDGDGDRFVEIWNLVFMQYLRHPDGRMTNLSKIGIDTGMGLERIAAVMQDKVDNYDIDVFQKLIKRSKAIIGSEQDIIVHKIIADHLRASAFLIADGVTPNNQGRGYVLRRIIRRAVRYAYKVGHKRPILYELFPVLQELFGGAYRELVAAAENIIYTLKSEEENFFNILEEGIEILHEMISNMKAGSVLSGNYAFKLYDTYGFPLDITKDILKEQGIEVDEDGFNIAMEEQKNRAKESWVGSGEENDYIWDKDIFDKTHFVRSKEGVEHDIGNNNIGTYCDQYVEGELIKGVFHKKKGKVICAHYVKLLISIKNDRTKVAHYKKQLQRSVDDGESFKSLDEKCLDSFIRKEIEDKYSKEEIREGDEVMVVLQTTPFYAQSGGQLGDTGSLYLGNTSNNFGFEIQAELRVTDTKKGKNGVHIHLCKVVNGRATKMQNIFCLAQINESRRGALSAAHSATHLLHFTLRQVLGKHLVQKGSLVDEDRLRFDFSHDKSLTLQELREVEYRVNKLIWSNHLVETKIINKSEAIKKGVIALFGEKYDDKVRVVKMCESIELCGGTHVESTGNIGMFKIVKESSIGSGIRRIEGLIRGKVLNFLYEEEKKHISVVESCKKKMKEHEKATKKNINELYKKIIKSVDADIRVMDGRVRLVIKVLYDISFDAVREIILGYVVGEEKSIFLFFSSFNKKEMCFIAITKDLVKIGITANDLIKKASEAMDVKVGGGKKELAQCAANFAKKDDVIVVVQSYIKTF